MLVFLPLTFPVFAYLIETPSRVRFIIHVHLDLSVSFRGFEHVKKNFAYTNETLFKKIKKAELYVSIF